MDDDLPVPGRVGAADLRATMGVFPTGVAVLTTTSGGEPVGLTVSSLTSVSLMPPLVLACVARTAMSLPAFRVGAPVGVTVLARDQAGLARHFGGRTEDRFAAVAHEPAGNGAPLLSGGSAWISGAVHRIYDAGDHVILLVHVEDLGRSDRAPLLFHSGVLLDGIEEILARSA